jgi:hypothetical protein
MSNQARLLEIWRAAWPDALAVWSRFTRLRDPLLCEAQVEAAKEGLSGSFAMIRLLDQSVVIDLETVERLRLGDYAVEILAHEIGHHVFAPGSATDQFRLLARIRRGLPTMENQAAMVANLYTDLYINDRLQRQAGLRMADIYRRLSDADLAGAHDNRLWRLYMRIYEHLWKLDEGTLTPKRKPKAGDNTEADAWLGARLIRVYASDWMLGAVRFAALVLPYLRKGQMPGPARFMHDTASAAKGCDPSGALEVEADEIGEAVHPSEDPLVNGQGDTIKRETTVSDGGSLGQAREPFEYGEILKAAGVTMSPHAVAMRYYHQRALPMLVPFPAKVRPESPEPELEGLEPWDVGSAFDQIDWLQSLLCSPRVIPGLTTVQRTYGTAPARERFDVPIDLDMYVDCSGSMPNPQESTSYPTLAGAIIALSALRTGAHVQVTLWSGVEQVAHTGGFTADAQQILKVLTGYFGGGTAFPIHRLRETYALKRPRATHILMVSDNGIDTMFAQDEQGNSGWDIAAKALREGAAGGTMALEMMADWDTRPELKQHFETLLRARDEQGWDIHAITDPAQLVAFAREFSRRHYMRDPTAANTKKRP